MQVVASKDYQTEVEELASIDLSSLTSVTGDVEVGGNEVNLASLSAVGGDVEVGGDEVDLSSLSSVGGDVRIATSVIDLPSLEVVGGELQVVDNDEVTVLSCPELVSVGGVWVNACPALTSIDLSKLTDVVGYLGWGWDDTEVMMGGVLIGGLKTVGGPDTGLPALTELNLPLLESVAIDPVFIEKTGLTSLTLPSLTSAAGHTLAVVENPALVSLEVPVLATQKRILIGDNDALTSVTFPALTSVEANLGVWGNDALAQCLVDALVAQVEAGDGIDGEVCFCVEPGGDCCPDPESSNNMACTCEEVDGVLEAACP